MLSERSQKSVLIKQMQWQETPVLAEVSILSLLRLSPKSAYLSTKPGTILDTVTMPAWSPRRAMPMVELGAIQANP